MIARLARPLYLAFLAQAGCVALLYLLKPAPIPVAALILLVIWAAAIASPPSAIAAIALTLPLFHHPLGIGDSEFAPSEVLTVLAAAAAPVWLGRQLLEKPRSALPRVRDIALRLVRSPLFIMLVVLCVVGALHVVWPYDPDSQSASFREWRWTLFEPLLLVGLLITCTRRAEERSLYVWSLLAGGFVVGLTALADLFTGSGLGVGGVTRLEGMFPHPNALALYLMRPVVLGAALLAYSGWRSPWIGPLATGFAALIGSFARSAFVALAVVAVALRRTLSVRLQLVAAGAAGLGLAALLVVGRDRLLNTGGGGSVTLRVEIWKSGLEMIRDRPIVGYGPDQFLYAYTPRYVDPAAWDERFTSHAHNFILDSWIRLGIIGAVFAVVATVYSLRALIQASREPHPIDPVPAAAALALGAAIIQGMVDNGYYLHDLAMSGWLLAWLAFGKRPLRSLRGTEHHARSGDRRSRARWLAPLR